MAVTLAVAGLIAILSKHSSQEQLSTGVLAIFSTAVAGEILLDFVGPLRRWLGLDPHVTDERTETIDLRAEAWSFRIGNLALLVATLGAYGIGEKHIGTVLLYVGVVVQLGYRAIRWILNRRH